MSLVDRKAMPNLHAAHVYTHDMPQLDGRVENSTRAIVLKGASVILFPS